MGIFEAEGFDSYRRKAQRHVRDLTNEIKAHITEEAATLMADIQASLDKLGEEIAQELQQVRDAVNAAAAAVSDNAAAQVALADAQATIDQAEARVQAFSSDLEADDPAPAPTEPPPA